MARKINLEIGLTQTDARASVYEPAFLSICGGPEDLLHWLESQLGLAMANHVWSSRVLEYSRALKSLKGSRTFSESFTKDPWITSAELAKRHEELELAGWDSHDHPGLPGLVRDMAQACKDHDFVFPSLADRLRNVLQSLNAGQRLPSHECNLRDPVSMWPKLWQSVLAHLNLGDYIVPAAAGRSGSSLRTIQEFVVHHDHRVVSADPSFRWVRSLSQTCAIEYVASYLVSQPDKLSRVAILCEDSSAAIQLDAALQRMGLPTMGVRVRSQAHPVLQVLPLALSLCDSPVDPQKLLDFLTLPVSPLPRHVRGRLADALTTQPGLGSSAWDATIAELCSPENDPDGKIRDKIQLWLYPRRCSLDQSIPTDLISERTSAIAQWATGLSLVKSEDSNASPGLISALRTATAQASLLGQISQSLGGDLSQPHLSRLLDEVRASGVDASFDICSENGPTHIRTLAELNSPIDQLIWLGLGTQSAALSPWSSSDIDAFRQHGIALDDGSNSLRALRNAECRGLRLVQDSVLAIQLPTDEENPLHPVWLAMHSLLNAEERKLIPTLENGILSGDLSQLAPFSCELERVGLDAKGVQRQDPPSVWSVDPALLPGTKSVSATDLTDRLACPLKWVLAKQAYIKPSPIAQLPSDYQLKGNFCHRVIELAFGNQGALPSVEDAVHRIGELFDQRLELDAAPLAQPERFRVRSELRKDLLQATKILIEKLNAGGYQIVGIEFKLSDVQAIGSPLHGQIDCLVRKAGGQEAIIDFKYAGKKYQSYLEEDKAVQLATYAYARSQVTGAFPAVAYLILHKSQLVTPRGSAIQGDGNRDVVGGGPIEQVWDRFVQALAGANEWLNRTGEIPIRPRQNADQWPQGLEIVLDPKIKSNELQEVCKYCNYKNLCGIGVVR